jgi:kynureninase
LTWEAWRSEFPIFRNTVYFNTCSLGALSTRVASSVERFLALWHEHGASAWYAFWLDKMSTVRAKYARTIGADPDEIALFPSITAALTSVASAFDYRERPRVAVSDLEFPTTIYQWLVKRDTGVEITPVASRDGLSVSGDDYAPAVGARTQLVIASHVYYTSGFIQDLAAVAEIAHARGAYCLIDAYQGTGQVPTDVHASGVDFLVTGGLKWLIGGPGIAFLYVRRDLHDRLRPNDVGWFAHSQQFAFQTEFDYASDARRFEGGTPSVAALYAQDAGLDIVLEIGVDTLRDRQLELVSDLVGRLRAGGFAPRVPADLNRHAGIVTVPVADPPAVVAALRRQGVIIDSRPGVVRFSPYFYNGIDDNRAVCETLGRVVAAGTPAG